MPSATPAEVLVVSGDDSSGGAGVAADKDALQALGVPGGYVVTAWTQQDAKGLREMGEVPPRRWLAEAHRLVTGELRAVKFGLLPSWTAAEAARELVGELPEDLPIVIDPVLSSSSGSRFHSFESAGELTRLLGPSRMIWTPNLEELAELAGVPPETLENSIDARTRAAQSLLDLGARAVVVKGGHGLENPLVDLLIEAGQEPQAFARERLVGAAIRGSGCRFASSLAGHLALESSLPDAIEAAGRFVAERLSESQG